MTSADWIAPTLENNWANFGSGHQNAGYLRDPLGFVHLQGAIAGGADGSIAFTLPAGYRPGGTSNYPSVNGASAFAFLQIAATGTVLVRSSNTTLVGLDGITFLAEN